MLQREARRTRDSFDLIFQVWGTFDIDNHANIAEAKNKAQDNDIRLAISNPCFELWGIYHFRDYHAPTSAQEVQRILCDLMPGYDQQGSKQFVFDLMEAQTLTAITRAVKGRAARAAEGNPEGNPSTSVDTLVCEILKFGSKGN